MWFFFVVAILLFVGILGFMLEIRKLARVERFYRRVYKEARYHEERYGGGAKYVNLIGRQVLDDYKNSASALAEYLTLIAGGMLFFWLLR